MQPSRSRGERCASVYIYPPITGIPPRLQPRRACWSVFGHRTIRLSCSRALCIGQRELTVPGVESERPPLLQMQWRSSRSKACSSGPGSSAIRCDGSCRDDPGCRGTAKSRPNGIPAVKFRFAASAPDGRGSGCCRPNEPGGDGHAAQTRGFAADPGGSDPGLRQNPTRDRKPEWIALPPQKPVQPGPGSSKR